MSQPPVALVNQLLRQARDGSDVAIEELFTAYRGYLRSLANHRLGGKFGGRLSPSDLVQDTLMAAWKDFESFRGIDAVQFSVWLRTILLRKVSAAIATHAKTSKRDINRECSVFQRVGSSVIEATHGLPGREQTPSTIVSLGEDKKLIQRLLQQLPEEYQVVIKLRHLEGIQFNEIAERLGKTSGAARLLWLRAIRMLRELHDLEYES